MLNFFSEQKRGDFFVLERKKIMLVKLEYEKKSQWHCDPIVFSDPSKDKTSVITTEPLHPNQSHSHNPKLKYFLNNVELRRLSFF